MDLRCSKCGGKLHKIVGEASLNECVEMIVCANINCSKCPWDGVADSGPVTSSSNWKFLDESESKINMNDLKRSYKFDGIISDAESYNWELSPDEVTKLHNNEITPDELRAKHSQENVKN